MPFTAPHTAVYTEGFAPTLASHHVRFNQEHSGAKRVNERHFVFDPEGAGSVLDTRQLRSYADFNVLLCFSDEVPAYEPFGYHVFAPFMNQHDNSGFGWAMYDFKQKRITWPDDEGLVPATPEAFGVLDHETTERMLGPGQVAVDQGFVDNAKRLADQERDRQVKYHHQRQHKRAAVQEGTAIAASAKNLEAFDKKRKALEDAADAARFNAKKQKKAPAPPTPTPGASTSTPTPTPGASTSTDTVMDTA